MWSLRMWPSSMRMSRSACASRRGSWVTTMMAAPRCLCRLVQQVDHDLAVRGVERGGRLVGKDQRRRSSRARGRWRRAGSRRRRARRAAGSGAHPGPRIAMRPRPGGALRALPTPQIFEHLHDLLSGVQRRKQIEALEDEAAMIQAELVDLSRLLLPEIFAERNDLARRRVAADPRALRSRSICRTRTGPSPS